MIDAQRIQFRVIGMDCADDAREIEEAARHVPGVSDTRPGGVQLMTLQMVGDRGGATQAAVGRIPRPPMHRQRRRCGAAHLIQPIDRPCGLQRRVGYRML